MQGAPPPIRAGAPPLVYPVGRGQGYPIGLVEPGGGAPGGGPRGSLGGRKLTGGGSSAAGTRASRASPERRSLFTPSLRRLCSPDTPERPEPFPVARHPWPSRPELPDIPEISESPEGRYLPRLRRDKICLERIWKEIILAKNFPGKLGDF